MNYRDRIVLVDRLLDCRAGGRGFDSWSRTGQGLIITEKGNLFLKEINGFMLNVTD